MIDRGIPRSKYEVEVNEEKIGFVTTGGFSPSLNKSIGLALIDSNYAQEGAAIEVIIRQKSLKAKIIAKPFYKKRYKDQ